jgi:hypothetical protein
LRFERIIRNASKPSSPLLEFDRAIFFPHTLPVSHVPGVVMHVQMALLIPNSFGHIFLL